MSSKGGFCFGCLSMSCQDCLQAQSMALKNIEVLLTRLEAAESLYPSSKAMGLQYPLYKTDEFIGRVKAMCLWYNMTRHLRLKLLILGKMLTR
jgi:mitogen-activated protein kinase kinase kinase 4